MTKTIAELEELMAWFRKQTPSAPDWYRGIDHVVGVLLAIEIERAKAAEAPPEPTP